MLWWCGGVVVWCCGVLVVVWCCGVVGFWCCGVVVLWCGVAWCGVVVWRGILVIHAFVTSILDYSNALLPGH